jgi:hypothetical protein
VEDLEWRKASDVGICNSAGDKSVVAWSLGSDRQQPLSGQELQRVTFVEACPDSALVCLGTRDIDLQNGSGIRTPPPKNSGFLFKDLL